MTREEVIIEPDPPPTFELPLLHVGKIPDPPKMGQQLDFRAMTHGCLIPDAEMARRLGETYVELLYGTEELERQRPFVTSDQADCWRVEGSWNRDKKLDGEAWFYATIWKYDGRLVDFGMRLNVVYSPEEKELIRKALSGNL